MAWLPPYNKLDETQLHFLDTAEFNKKNQWLKGFPGSGKSVLLVYTLQKIKKENPNSSVMLIVFTKSLVEMFKAAFRELKLKASIGTQYDFKKTGEFYDYILCDEVQDLSPNYLSLMKNRAKHIVVADDPNQSIFEKDPQTNERTVYPSEITDLISGNSYELNYIHRLSQNII